MQAARAEAAALALAKQFCKFALVGLTNTAISVAVFDLLSAARLPYAPAAAIAFLAGAVNGYIWNRRWTFQAIDSTRARLAYLCVQVLGLGATSLLAALLGPVEALGPTAVYLLTVPPVTVGMFLANRSWTFAQRERPEPVRRRPPQSRRESVANASRLPR
jgi:putative flippase GtrA